jgi:C-terminal processing protease CtpA/Prc
VEDVVKDGAAFQSGKMQISDLVKSVDSVRVGRRHGYGRDKVKNLILGLPETPVTLRIIRKQEELDVVITRAPLDTLVQLVGAKGTSLEGASQSLENQVTVLEEEVESLKVCSIKYVSDC